MEAWLVPVLLLYRLYRCVQVISTADIALYGGLTALASFDRPELRTQVCAASLSKCLSWPMQPSDWLESVTPGQAAYTGQCRRCWQSVFGMLLLPQSSYVAVYEL